MLFFFHVNYNYHFKNWITYIELIVFERHIFLHNPIKNLFSTIIDFYLIKIPGGIKIINDHYFFLSDFFLFFNKKCALTFFFTSEFFISIFVNSFFILKSYKNV